MKAINPLTAIRTTIAALALMALSSTASATTILADLELDYGNSGAYAPFGTGYFGGSTSGFPIALLDSSNATDGNISTFVSLPTLSYITLGFSAGVVIDGIGNDLFVAETGSAAEVAEVWISSDFGSTFTYLGDAFGNTVTEFDFASISYTGAVNAVKVIGKDSNGGSPGFDLAYIEGLEGSVVLPAPAGIVLLGMGLLGLGLRRRTLSA